MTKTALYIDHGRVNCPERGDTDIDLCFTCLKLVDFASDGATERLVCNGRSARLGPVRARPRPRRLYCG
jgi:hypothetical protein